MGLIKWTSGLVFVGLFVLSILMYSTNFAIDNNSPIILSSDADYNSIQTEYSGNLSQFVTDSNTTSEAYYKSSIKSGDVASESGGQFKGGIGTAKNIATTSLSAGFKKIFGSDTSFAIIFSIIGAMLVFIAVMYGYAAWRSGNVD